jgi:hypothetical protein
MYIRFSNLKPANKLLTLIIRYSLYQQISSCLGFAHIYIIFIILQVYIKMCLGLKLKYILFSFKQNIFK